LTCSACGPPRLRVESVKEETDDAQFQRGPDHRGAAGSGGRGKDRGGLSAAWHQHDAFYKWKARYGGLEVCEARRLKALEDENRRLKKLLAEAVLDVGARSGLVHRAPVPATNPTDSPHE